MNFDGAPFALIPSFVLDSDLSDSELRLYAKISQLTNKEGFCFAKNAYLAEITHKSIPTINRILAKLAKKELIKIEIKNGRDRKIYLNLDYKHFYNKDNTLTNEQKQPVKAKTDDKQGEAIPQQEKQLKTQKKEVIAKNATSDLKTKEKKPVFDMRSVELPSFIDPQVWLKYCNYKAERKEKLTQTGIQAKFSEWKKWHSEGININDCIETAMANEWRGVFKPKGHNFKNSENQITMDEINANFNLGYDEPSPFDTSEIKALREMRNQMKRIGNEPNSSD